MVSPSCESIQEFLNEYDRYCTECDYLIQWLQAVQSKCLCLQGNPNYDTALSVQERANLEANYAAAQGCTIISETPPPAIPNPPKQ